MSLAALNSKVTAAEMVSLEISKVSSFPFGSWTIHQAPTRITLSGSVEVHDDIGRKLGNAKFTISLAKSEISIQSLVNKLDIVFTSPWDEKMADRFDLETQVKDILKSTCSALTPSISNRIAPVEQIPLI